MSEPKISVKRSPKNNSNLNALCFDSILNYFDNSHKIDDSLIKENSDNSLFVSWKNDSSKKKELKGCTGTFQSKNLLHSLKSVSVRSAFFDSRFKPIQKKEIKHLLCEVSILSPFEKAKDFYDWKIGKHGILIVFKKDDNSYSATFLPDVIKEQGWNHEETIKNLIRKSNFGGSYKDVWGDLQIFKYQSEKSSLNFDDYCALKKERGADIKSY
ncbi:AMME chromosomal region protein 1-like [Bonamia ostreae]|uniref:AMME chromosomal region protein 1-like n=1 Tax=Bonamia ostreae TaxID=126728 RepID=A0ABV2ALC4_9EUKA